MTTILTCTCKHEFQDAEYGRNKRVFNKKEKSGTTEKATCTVCGNVKTL